MRLTVSPWEVQDVDPGDEGQINRISWPLLFTVSKIFYLSASYNGLNFKIT